MNLHLNKGNKMKKNKSQFLSKEITIILLSLLCLGTLNAQNKLDTLDQQSHEFFKSVIGLEKDYLKTQMDKISSSKRTKSTSSSKPGIKQEKMLSQEDIDKDIFKHQNDMAEITSNFTRTKKLKDLKIKSLYTFNKVNYVVLTNSSNKNKSINKEEFSLDVEGRYKRGDYILTHRVQNINTRTKTIKLYKKVDKEYGYYIYINNNGISVSSLQKVVKNKKRSSFKTQKKNKNYSSNRLCRYKVKARGLNIRASKNKNSKVIAYLSKNDQFSIIIKNNAKDKGKIDSIYRTNNKIEVVRNNSYWTSINMKYVTLTNKNCQ